MRKFLTQFLIYGCASMLSKIAAIFLMPLYTGVLTTGEYGAMAMINSCSAVIGILANLNIHSGIARDYFEKGVDRKKLVSTGFFSILLCSVFIALIVFLTRNQWINMLKLQSYKVAFVLMIADLPTVSLQSYFAILTRYKSKPVLFLIGSVSQLMVQIGTAVYLVLIRQIGVEGIFVASLVANIYGTVFFLIVNREFINFTFDKAILRKALVFSIPTLPAILAWWIDTSLGQVLIGKYVSYDVLGVYSVALSITSVFSLITIAFKNVWGPYLYENYQHEGFLREANNLYKLFFLLLVIISVNLSLLAEEVVLILSQPTYIDAVKYITLLCFPLSIYMLHPFFSSGISLSRKTKYTSLANCVGSAVNLLLLVIFLPHFGVIVAPLSLAASRLINFYISKHYSQRALNLNLRGNWMFIFMGILAVCYFINGIDLPRVSVWCGLLVADILTAVYFIRHFKLKHIIEMFKK